MRRELFSDYSVRCPPSRGGAEAGPQHSNQLQLTRTPLGTADATTSKPKSPPPVKTRLIVESSREGKPETKPAAEILRLFPRRRHHPHHLHRPHPARPRYLCLIAARR